MLLSHLLNRLNIRNKILFSALVLLLPVTIAGGVAIYFLVSDTIEKRIESELENTTKSILNIVRTDVTASIKNRLRAIAEKNLELCRFYWGKYEKSEITRDEAILRIREFLLNQRVGKDGYTYCIDSKGVAVLHHQSGVEGKNLSNNGFIQQQIKMKNGYLEYLWKNPGERKEREKALYMSYFKPLDYIISVSAYRDDFRDLINIEDLRSSILTLKFGTSGFSFVTDSKGNFIIHPTREGINTIESGIATKEFLDGIIKKGSGKFFYLAKSPENDIKREALIFYNYLAEMNWILASLCYYDEMFLPLKRIKNTMFVILICFIFLTFIFALWISIVITNPIKKLRESFAAGAEGHLHMRMDYHGKDELGQLAKYYNIFMDKLQSFQSKLETEIEERKEIENQLRDNNAMLSTMFKNFPFELFLLDRNGIFDFQNSLSIVKWGNVIGSMPEDLSMPSDISNWYRGSIERALSGDTSRSDLQYQDNFELFEYYCIIAPVKENKEIKGILGINIDITEQKKAERALFESQERYTKLFQSSSDGIVILGSDGNFVDANPAFLNMIGYNFNELVGRSLSDLNPHQSDRIYWDDIQKVSEVEKSQEAFLEKVYMRKDGTVFPASLKIWVIKDRDGKIKMIGAFIKDISSLKESEGKLQRLSTAIENAAEDIVITDPTGTIEYVNPAFEQITGYSKDEAIGKNPRILKSGRHDERFYKKMWDTITRGQIWTGRLTNRRKNGDLIEQEANISPIRNELEEIIGFVSVKRDVTEQLKIEKQFRQSQKMQAIGTLAGGIAHDFNNILAAIVGFTELAQSSMPAESEIRGYLDNALVACGRAKDLIQQILTFSRQTEQESKPLKVKHIAKEVLKLLRASLPVTMDIKQYLTSDSLVMADPTQIHQIILNLCTNAAQALVDEKGFIQLNLEDIQIDVHSASQYPDLVPGKYVKLTVMDNGKGIPQEFLERVFEPFFTTKELGKGTGMGLAVTHGAVKNMGGSISVYSEPTKGTTFTVLMPAIEQQEVADVVFESEPKKGSETVLFVDDEEALTEIMEQMLGNLGYKVKTTTNSSEALSIFKQTPQAFDLVITDLTMPVMTGEQLAVEVLSIRPDIPVILATGFSERLSEEHLKILGVKKLLLKPIITRELAQAIREVLDGDPSDSDT